MFWNIVFFLMGVAISYHNFGVTQLRHFFTKLDGVCTDMKSLYLNMLEIENKEKNENKSFRMSALIKCGRFIYNNIYERVLLSLRKRLFPPIFLKNNKILYPLFVHNGIKYVAISSTSEVNKTDILSVSFTPQSSKLQNLFPSILSISSMERLNADDFGVDKIEVSILNKYFSLETLSFEKDKSIDV
jgi:hypothetical protein